MLELALALQLAVAATGPGDVFGLEIGKPISLPMCRSIVLPEKGTCLVKMRKGETRGTVRFSHDESPSIVRGDMTVIVLDGNLEGVTFDSVGGPLAKSVIDKLVAKYGQPDITQAGENQNAFGVKTPWSSAVWKDVNGLYVSYNDGVPGLGTSILIQTHKATAATAAEVAGYHRNERKL